VKGKGIVLGISDVVTGEIEAIGSAPMYTKKLPTKRDIDLIVSHYKLDKKLSKKVLQIIQNYTPRKKKKEFPHFIISDNEIALKAGKKQATKLGYKTTVAPFLLGGEAKVMAKKISRYSQSLKKRSSKSSLCILIGGETTVTLKGNGKGGRNQEFVLAMMKELKDCSKISYFSGGTDGIDGNSPYAGAYGSVRGYKKSIKQGLDLKKYLSNNDSSSFFEKIDG
ncbi:MAG: DUF4147 domain-containing protein, partial [Campylobacterales bacterium]|nr:DUF4147 domain-containing protein [Campylobacterales bacterium]